VENESVEMSETLQSLECYRIKLTDDIATLTKNYEMSLVSFRSALGMTYKKIELLAGGMDLEKIARAAQILEIRGTYLLGGQDKRSVIVDAIEWFSTGSVRYLENGQPNPYKNLFVRYFGTKNYDGWVGQRSDHEYYMGPRHGSTIFSIGIQKVHRDRYEESGNYEKQIPKNYTFALADIEAVLYYLHNIEKIESAMHIGANKAGESKGYRNGPNG